MKKIKIIIIILLLLLITLFIAKNIIAKTALSAGVRAITGLRLSIQKMNVGILNTLISVKDMKLYNPAGFPDEIMINMPQIYIDYDLGAFLKKKVHLEEVRLNLKEFVVVKNKENQLNLNALNVVKEKKAGEPAKEKVKAKRPEIRIDKLKLKIGKVIYKDYSAGTPPVTREFNLNIDEYYENITDPYALGSLIIVRALMNTAVSSLANFDLGSLKQSLTGTLKDAATLGKDAVEKALETGKGITEEATEVVGQTLQKTTETIKKIIPFGE